MKKVYQIISTVALSLLAIGSFGQNANLSVHKSMQQASPKFKNDFRYQLKRIAGTPGVSLNWDSADDFIYSPSYSLNQGQMMNMHYNWPADSSINYCVVAFDTMFDPYAQTYYADPTKIKIDTIYVPIVQVNHSTVADTLDVQINSVTNIGYPTSTVLLDTMIVSTNISSLNSTSLIDFLHIGFNKTITAKKFAVTLKYYGSHADSCYFIYGFPNFCGRCLYIRFGCYFS